MPRQYSGAVSREFHEMMIARKSREIADLRAELAAERAKRERMLDAAQSYQELAMCYRIGRAPSERLFKRLDDAHAALDAEKGE